MARTIRFEDPRIHLFILKNDADEEVERWIEELIHTLKAQNIVCLKEGDYEKIGENVFASLQRAIKSAENVMVVLSDGFINNGHLMFKFYFALHRCLTRKIPFLPVLSINVLEPPIELSTTICLKVDFSEKLKENDVRKLEQALNLADIIPNTLSELEKDLLILGEKIKAASPAVLTQLSHSSEFKEVLSLFNNINNGDNSEGKEGKGQQKRKFVQRSKSDGSVIKSVKGRKPRIIAKVAKSNSFNYQKKQLTIYPYDMCA